MKKNLTTLPIALIAISLLFTISCNKVENNPENSNSVKDAEGNTYKTVKIGSQVWMAENLKTTKYNDGTLIPMVSEYLPWTDFTNTSPGFCYYNNTTNLDSINKFGALYNWYAVNTQKLAPKGWHIPTQTEVDTLQNFLIAHGFNNDHLKYGNRLAISLASNSDWNSSLDPANPGYDMTKNNTSGFNGMPSGYRAGNSNYGFGGLNDYGQWWTISEASEFQAYSFYINNDYEILNRSDDYKIGGYAIRCVKD